MLLFIIIIIIIPDNNNACVNYMCKLHSGNNKYNMPKVQAGASFWSGLVQCKQKGQFRQISLK